GRARADDSLRDSLRDGEARRPSLPPIGLAPEGGHADRRAARAGRRGVGRGRRRPAEAPARRVQEHAGERVTDQELLQRARASLAHAAAPYSKFRVAAALEDASGAVHPGVNVESASLPLTICAERNALFGALARGAKDFRRMAIVAERSKPILPCGAC